MRFDAETQRRRDKRGEREERVKGLESAEEAEEASITRRGLVCSTQSSSRLRGEPLRQVALGDDDGISGEQEDAVPAFAGDRQFAEGDAAILNVIPDRFLGPCHFR